MAGGGGGAARGAGGGGCVISTVWLCRCPSLSNGYSEKSGALSTKRGRRPEGEGGETRGGRAGGRSAGRKGPYNR